MRVEFKRNKWRSWAIYHPDDNIEKTIIELLNDKEHLESVLANEMETSIESVIEYSDAITRVNTELGAILG